VLALNQGPGRRFVLQLLERGRTRGAQKVEELKTSGQIDAALDPDIVRMAFVSLAMTPMLLKDIFEEQRGSNMDDAFSKNWLPSTANSWWQEWPQLNTYRKDAHDIAKEPRRRRRFGKLTRFAAWLQNIPNKVTPAPFRLMQIGSAFWQSRALYVAAG